ncbi:hypothetical protein Amet_3146 [Alkaliphilus metalliredigens QYMF]|uniref:Uncharacterized protein n=1 Tax=Alkaliphilus metalliredigens (strain QYMF) TaxID=293826 RepID=A6TSW7_ALKMQ|nr:hypothetical protein [Alkaliphilus metalliredigens]ABR49285.1 hypothetical protein Amet_3146 [Alkaliphilus metalliredigens QYMF]
MSEYQRQNNESQKIDQSQQPWTWFLFLMSGLFLFKRGTGKLEMGEVDVSTLEKKARLLNRIKGYMVPEEQSIVHRAEIILQVIANVKRLSESPQHQNAGVQYHSLSFEDRKRNMLMDLSEFIEEDKRRAVHKAVDLDLKLRATSDKLSQMKQGGGSGNVIGEIQGYVEAFEHLLEGDVKVRTTELRKMMSMLKLITSIESKGKIDETDLIEMISPLVEPEQRDSLMQMMQIIKAVGNIQGQSKEEEAMPSNVESEGGLDKEED